MKPRILMVDDEANVLSGLQRALHREPFEVLLAASGIEALNLLRAAPVDVIVSDLEMPGMNGIELLAKARHLWPDTVRIILTGKATVDSVIKAINEGAVSRFITKPCQLDDLILALRQSIEHRRLMGEARRLLAIVKRQSDVLESLEKESPGITRVHRDASGAVVIDEPHRCLDDLLRDIEAHAGRAEHQLGRAAEGKPV